MRVLPRKRGQEERKQGREQKGALNRAAKAQGPRPERGGGAGSGWTGVALRAGSGQAPGPRGSRKHGGPRKELGARELREAQGQVGKGQIHVFTEFSFSRLCFLAKGDVTLQGEKRY